MAEPNNCDNGTFFIPATPVPPDAANVDGDAPPSADSDAGAEAGDLAAASCLCISAILAAADIAGVLALPALLLPLPLAKFLTPLPLAEGVLASV